MFFFFHCVLLGPNYTIAIDGDDDDDRWFFVSAFFRASFYSMLHVHLYVVSTYFSAIVGIVMANASRSMYQLKMVHKISMDFVPTNHDILKCIAYIEIAVKCVVWCDWSRVWTKSGRHVYILKKKNWHFINVKERK